MYVSENLRLRQFGLVCVSIGGFAIGSTASAACVDTNTCFGTGALEQHVSGHNNSAFGYRALRTDVSGLHNTAVGARALSNTDLAVEPIELLFAPGSLNTAIGSHALNGITEGIGNTAIGAATLLLNWAGQQNVAVGLLALERNQNGSFNVAVGPNAMQGNVSGTGNTAVGSEALSIRSGEGSGNVAIGARTMMIGDDGPGSENFRYRGQHNVAVGVSAMFQTTSGDENTAVGYEALAGFVPNSSTGVTGGFNTAIGAGTLTRNSSGASNTAAGHHALFQNATGTQNTAVGVNAMRNGRQGIRNTAIGAEAGYVALGNDNIHIGAGNRGNAADSGVIRIGKPINQQKTFVAGITGVKTGLSSAVPVLINANGQLGTIKSSRLVKEDILPMGDVSDRLLALRPVTFRYKQADDDGSKPIQYGLIAEEVAESFPELVVFDANGKPETVSYHLLATLLLNEFQKERSVTQAQATRIAELEEEFARLAEVVDRLNHASMVATAH